jgi:hypothetical protein
MCPASCTPVPGTYDLRYVPGILHSRAGHLRPPVCARHLALPCRVPTKTIGLFPIMIAPTHSPANSHNAREGVTARRRRRRRPEQPRARGVGGFVWPCGSDARPRRRRPRAAARPRWWQRHAAARSRRRRRRRHAAARSRRWRRRAAARSLRRRPRADVRLRRRRPEQPRADGGFERPCACDGGSISLLRSRGGGGDHDGCGSCALVTRVCHWDSAWSLHACPRGRRRQTPEFQGPEK